MVFILFIYGKGNFLMIPYFSAANVYVSPRKTQSKFIIDVDSLEIIEEIVKKIKYFNF